jgi:hypothetical protein
MLSHYIVCSACTVNLIPELLDKSDKALMSLFSPEDTTDNQCEGHLQIARHDAYNFSGLIEVVFWVAISISIALLMGRLS